MSVRGAGGSPIEVSLRQKTLRIAGEARPLEESDAVLFASWADRYRTLRGEGESQEVRDRFVLLGREMLEWLDGRSGKAFSLALEDARPPLFVEFSTRLHPDADEVAFLDAPWELLSGDDGSLAGDPKLLYCPFRRLGKADPADRQPEPSEFRLSLLYSAASPRKASALNFDREEAQIQRDAGLIGLDWGVEESGMLKFLAERLATETPDVLHVSCHGSIGWPATQKDPEMPPHLLLEEELGDRAPATVDDLAMAFGGHRPRLLFLSACETASPERTVGSLAAGMVFSGFPAVLGWGGSVFDQEAARFAAALYRGLARHESLLSALAHARKALFGQSGETPSPEWHTARLFLGASDGGRLCEGTAHRRRDPGAAQKVFLDRRNQRVLVAGPREFVGRRRPIQDILRAFRAPREVRPAGVLIHALGHQGKSSLAARIAQRLDRHELLVVHGAYDEEAILSAFAQAATDGELKGRIDADLARVRDQKSTFGAVLRGLLEGPFRQEEKNTTKRPVLLVIDDFEQVLVAGSNGALHSVQADIAPAIRAVIQAFGSVETESRLLFTSRFEFVLFDERGQKDLAKNLRSVALPAMTEAESIRQANAKLEFGDVPNADLDLSVIERVIEVSRGNPGLQDLLFQLANKEPAACERAVGEMAKYLASGELPEEGEVGKFLTDILFREVLGLLTDGERELFRASTLFQLPVPREVLEGVADARGLAAGRPPGVRLGALGLWEEVEDVADPHRRAISPNALGAAGVAALGDEEIAEFAALAAPSLLKVWVGEGKKVPWPSLISLEISRLGLAGDCPEVLVRSAAAAVRTRERYFDYRGAAALGKQALVVLERHSVSAPISLLQTVGEQAQQVGEVETARDCFTKALASIDEEQEATDPEGVAAIRIARSRLLVQQGSPDEALQELRRAEGNLTEERFARERAIVLGDLARILVSKGQVDEALALHQERLEVFQQLGDTRLRAVTLGDLARILVSKGQVDEALALHQEEIKVYEQLGDTRSRAVTLGDLARILVSKGQVDEALALHQERLEVFEQLGDTRERAVTLGDLARILRSKGQVDEALALHQERLEVFEQLGDTRSRAVALGDLARILVSKGQVDEALALHQEEIKVYEQLGDTRSRAVTLGDLARILVDKGQVDEALQLHQERLEVFLELGDLDGQAHTLWSLAQIEIQREVWQPAFEHLAEAYRLNLQIGRLEGICFVGLGLGHFLCASGQVKGGREILERSRAGFVRLGREGEARRAEELLEQFPSEGE